MPSVNRNNNDASLKSVINGIADISDRTQRIVHDEIELVKAELTTKAKSLGVGVAVAAVGGTLALLALFMFLHAIAWFFNYIFFGGDADFVGYLVLSVLMLIAAAVSAFVTWRFVRKAGKPKPEMAIEEAKLVRQAVAASRSQQIPAGQDAPTQISTYSGR